MIWRAQNLVQNITTCPLHTQRHFAPVNIIILTKQAVFIFCDEHGRIFVPNLSKKKLQLFEVAAKERKCVVHAAHFTSESPTCSHIAVSNYECIFTVAYA